MTLRQLGHEMYEWTKRALLARPPGAVVRIPRKVSAMTIRRCVMFFFFDLGSHNLVTPQIPEQAGYPELPGGQGPHAHRQAPGQEAQVLQGDGGI